MEGLRKESAKFQKKLADDEANVQRERTRNPFSGNFHLQNGKKEFADGSGEIGGVNDWVQVHHKKHHH